MKKGAHSIIFFLVLMGLIFSCSTKKDTFINRTSHSVVSKYNVLYNGNVAFDEAKAQLDATYEDNFWEILPIEPIKIEDKIPMPGENQTENPIKTGFAKSEEKAVKAIQKHSMVIDGFERNNQIDEAYLLLGKSRYYSQRFVPALEAFTFALEKYPNANLYYDTKIWKSKTDIRLQNEKLAIETLDNMVKGGNLSEGLTEKAYTALAMAYRQLDSLQQTIDNLKLATYYYTDDYQGARNMFILGQLYREQQKIDSSNMMFEALTYLKKVPRKYKVHAQIERAKNFSEKDSSDALIYALRSLVDDRENRPYYDELYYQAGLIAQKRGNQEKAQEYFAASVLFNTAKPFQKSLSYEALGDWYFDNTMYSKAGAYYDSVLQITQVDQNTKRMRRISAKSKSLEEVIFFENLLKTNDSIIYLVNLPEAEKKIYFENYVTELQKADELQKVLEENQKNFGSEFLGVGSKQNAGETFYFYDSPRVAMGKQEFKMRYGNRALTDNWIYSQISVNNQENTVLAKTESVDLNLRYDPEFYIQSIPTDPLKIDSIRSLRKDAHYNLGLLYKERFKEYELAAKHFEDFLASDPPENLILPVKYQLHKSYENFNPDLSNKFADDIVTNYSSSRYAQMINNPQEVVEFDNNDSSPENVYKSAFICYEEGEFEYALSLMQSLDASIKELPIEAKFELLKAYIALKTEGREAFKEQLSYVLTHFPNTDESAFAQQALEMISKKE